MLLLVAFEYFRGPIGGVGGVAARHQKPASTLRGRQDMTEVTVSAIEDGAVLLTIIDSENRVQVRLPLEAAQKLHAQVQAALVIARVRARALEG
jgi:hypothetical protein